ncbi:MAG: hypothetical protein R3Y64_05635 [Peptostreptococcaceae bacterium]
MNYYEYCKNISNEYYPRLYFKVRKYVENVLDEFDKDELHPFPNCVVFENIVNKIYEKYKKDEYQKCINGEIVDVDLIRKESVELFQSLIRIILINELIKTREKHKDYPLYF